MKNLFLFFMAVLAFGCHSDKAQQAENRAAFKEVKLICEEQLGLDAEKHTAVYAILKDSKVKLAEIHDCSAIDDSEFEKFNIPKKALFAVGGKGGDHEDYVYATVNEEDRNELLFYIHRIELSGENNHSKGTTTALASFKKDKFQVLRPLHLADISGYYMYEGTDTSHVLFLGMKGPKLSAKLFSTEEKLPAQKMLQRALPEFESQPDTDFDCELNTLVFNSSLGNGTIYWRPDSAAVQFNNFLESKEDVSFELISF